MACCPCWAFLGGADPEPRGRNVGDLRQHLKADGTALHVAAGQDRAPCAVNSPTAPSGVRLGGNGDAVLGHAPKVRSPGAGTGHVQSPSARSAVPSVPPLSFGGPLGAPERQPAGLNAPRGAKQSTATPSSPISPVPPLSFGDRFTSLERPA